MPYTVTQLKNAAARKLHGTTANQITDFYGLLYDVAAKCQEDCDFDETRRTVQLASPVYGQAAFDYACPADLKGNRVIDLRPQANRLANDVPRQLYSRDFDVSKTRVLTGSSIEVRWDTYLKTLRIAVPALKNVLVNGCDGVSANGTWTAGGGASGVASNDVYFTSGTASIQYSLSGSGYVENATMAAVDLSDYEDQGVVFCWAYCQSTLPTSYEMRWGSDTSANYWSKSVSSQWDGTAFVQGWNLLGFDWQTAAQTGSPSSSAVDSVRLTTTITGSASPVFLDGIVCSLGSILEIEYYSKYLFRSASGAFKERPTADTDLLNLDTDSYGVFTNCLALLAAQQQQGADSSFDLAFFERAYRDSAASYNRRFPSQCQKPAGSYYAVKRSSYASKLGGATLRP